MYFQYQAYTRGMLVSLSIITHWGGAHWTFAITFFSDDSFWWEP